MYLSYYDLTAMPFEISTDPDFLWLGEKHQEALATLRYGVIAQKGFLLLTGDVGTGKTTLLNTLLETLGEDVVVAKINDPEMCLLDMLNYIARLFGMESSFENKMNFLVGFSDFLKSSHQNKKILLLIIDEAHRLSVAQLEQLRLLSNIELARKKLINIFFVGQNELENTLALDECRALKQRIALRYHIAPLSLEETSKYILHRLATAGAVRDIFSESAMEEVFRVSGGFPRLINILCDHALLTGFSEEKQLITPEIIKECAGELDIVGPNDEMQYRNSSMNATPLQEPLSESHKNTEENEPSSNASAKSPRKPDDPVTKDRILNVQSVPDSEVSTKLSEDISGMSEQDGQLAADYRDIRQRFSASPQIKVRAVQGDPPDVYEIDYLLKGLHQEADSPEINAGFHTVRIDLPYGYPMVPPVCQPVSPIFHPDFAPNDICVGGFWEKTPSLPDLIIHIGRLIAFQLYSREDVYNPKALAWVQGHGNLLPLDTTDFSSLAFYEMPREQTPRQGRKAEDHALQDLAGAPEESFISQMDEPIDDLLNYELPTTDAPWLSQGMRFVVITVLTVVLATAVGGFYMLSLWHYDGAIQQWITVGPLLEQGKYLEADQQLQTILARLDKVRLVNKANKLQLLEQINKVRSTEQFRQGLHGNVLFNDHYYSKQEMESFHDIKKRLAKGEAFGSGGRWREAVVEYESAAQQTLLLGQWAPVSEALLRKTLHYARLQEMITVAERLMAEKDWRAAEAHLQKTLRMQAEIRDDLDPRKAEELQASLRTTMAELQNNMGEEAFASGIKQGDQFLAQKQWSQAAASYEGALLVAERTGGELARRAETIRPQWRFASFQANYEEGVAALQAGNWNDAIQCLERSEKLRSKIVATGMDVTIDEKMIRRKILQARISRAEAAASDSLAKKKYGQANKALAEIVAVVDQSALAAEKEFAVAKTAAEKRITNNGALLEIEEQQVYLEKNYKEIFAKYFPSSANSDLVSPKISFVKKDDVFLYFVMQCRAERNRRHTNLELDYKYNRTVGRWEGR